MAKPQASGKSFIIPLDLPILLDQLRERRDEKTFCAILRMIDPLVARMVIQLQKKWDYLQVIDANELYHTALIAVHRACLKFKVREPDSIYAFPMYLKSTIAYEFQRTYYKQSFCVTIDGKFEDFADHMSIPELDARWKKEHRAMEVRVMFDHLATTKSMKPHVLQVLRLHYIDGLSQIEISKKLMIPFSKAKYWIRQGLKELRHVFKVKDRKLN